MKNTVFSIILLAISFSSCGLIELRGSFRGLYGYQKITTKEDPEFIKYEYPICNLKNDQIPGVLAINGEQIRNCIKAVDSVLVYVWEPGCSGPTCIPPDALQFFCDERDIDLLVVSVYYDREKFSEVQNLERPLLAIDSYYYRTSFTRWYKRRFINDLHGEKTATEDWSRFYLFVEGELIKKSFDIYDIFPSQ